MALALPLDVGASAALVRVLLAAQAPAFANLPVTWFATGRDCATYRLGESMLVRLPLDEQAAIRHDREVRWLPMLSPTLTAPTPQPVFVGSPSQHFPHTWSVVEFIPGTWASAVESARSSSLAEELADLLWALHQPAPTHAPVNPERGGSLATPASDALVRDRLAQLARQGEAALVESLLPRWEAWLAAPDFDRADAWVHGDLHPHSIIVDANGHLAGVINWGDLTAGDPACDLATAWLTFDEVGRRAFTERANQGGAIDQATWTRAKAWALHLALSMMSQPDTRPAFLTVGLRSLRALATEPR